MKNSLIILLCFAAGVLCSYWGIIPECDDSLSLYILYVMMFLVGIGLGSDLTALSAPIKKYKFQILLIPLSTIVATSGAVNVRSRRNWNNRRLLSVLAILSRSVTGNRCHRLRIRILQSIGNFTERACRSRHRYYRSYL